MQVDIRSHPNPKGKFNSREHIEQAAAILKGCLEEVRALHPTWPQVQKLRGAVAAYNFGSDDVRTISGMDQGTTGNDYSNDVWARARFLAPQFGGGEGANTDSALAQGSSAGTAVGVLPWATGQQGPLRSPIILDLQNLLIRHGYMTQAQMETGPGILGSKTRAAVAKLFEDYDQAKKAATAATGESVSSSSSSSGASQGASVPQVNTGGSWMDPDNRGKAYSSRDGVPVYNQGDSDWDDHKLYGTGRNKSEKEKNTIQQKGCAITSCAMALSLIHI